MIVDIFNEVFTKLKSDLSPLATHSHYPEVTPTMDCVILEQLSNNNVQFTVDTSGDKYNEISFEVNIFTQGAEKASKARAILKKVDAVMADFYRMNRDYSGTLPSFLDNNIYRMIVRYSCIVDKNKQIYRR